MLKEKLVDISIETLQKVDRGFEEANRLFKEGTIMLTPIWFIIALLIVLLS